MFRAVRAAAAALAEADAAAAAFAEAEADATAAAEDAAAAEAEAEAAEADADAAAAWAEAEAPAACADAEASAAVSVRPLCGAAEAPEARTAVNAAADGLSWRVPFFAIAALALIELAVVRLAIPAAPPTRQIPVGPFTAFRGQFKAAFAEPTVAFVLFSSLLWWAGNQGLFANTGVFYGGIYRLSTAKIGWIVLVTGAAGFGGNMLGGKLADRLGKRPVIATAAGGAAVTMVAFSSLTGTLAAAIGVQVAWSLFFGLGQASLTTLVSELSPKARGTALSLNGSAQYSGMMLGTAIAALILDHGGRFVWVGSVSALFCALVLPIVLWLVRERTGNAAPNPAAAQPEPSAR